MRQEVDRIGGVLVTMAKSVREAMRQGSAALLAADPVLAQVVIARDAEIDVLAQVVEDRVYALARAGDWRLVTTATHVGADLARMGDLAVHVAKVTLRRHPEPAVIAELAGIFAAMSMVADQMAATIVSVLANRDVQLAAGLDREDDAMDDLHRELFTVLRSPEWPLGVEGAIDGALLGRYYERYADHAVNVGHRVVTLVTGESSARPSAAHA